MATKEVWIASSRALLAMTENVALTLGPVISATLAAAVAVNTHPRDLSRVRELLPDEARKVLQRRRSEPLDLVEHLVVEDFLHVLQAALQQAEIEHHPG